MWYYSCWMVQLIPLSVVNETRPRHSAPLKTSNRNLQVSQQELPECGASVWSSEGKKRIDLVVHQLSHHCEEICEENSLLWTVDYDWTVLFHEQEWVDCSNKSQWKRKAENESLLGLLVQLVSLAKFTASPTNLDSWLLNNTGSLQVLWPSILSMAAY